MYKAIVFDLDGTLIDSPLCFETIKRELDIPSGDYILEHLDTLPAASRAIKHKRLEEIEVEAARSAILFPGVSELLVELKNYKIKTGIFTRNCRAVVNLVVKNFNLDFDMLVTREDAPAKPDPAGIRKFLSHWGIDKHELLFVGDFRFDIECGKKAGVKTARFTNGLEPEADWAPDHIFHDYSKFRLHID